MKTLFVINTLLTPYFDKTILMLSARDPKPKQRIGDMKTLQTKLERFFATASCYADLDNQLAWDQFQLTAMSSLSRNSLITLTNDTNTILKMMHEDNKISFIFLIPPKRKYNSSYGFGLEKTLHFTSQDVRDLWRVISRYPDNEYSLMFALIICTCCSPLHLSHLVVNGIGRWTVSITNDGLIHSILLEPAKTLLLRHIDQHNLERDAFVFKEDVLKTFPTWLMDRCREACVGVISSSQLAVFSRLCLVRFGVPPYAAAMIGKKNSFAPLTEDSCEHLIDLIKQTGDSLWKLPIL